jgi:acyl-coenzyme A thioesterase PaaI-like protein
MDPVATHLRIRPDWVGAVVDAAPGTATVRLETRPEMAADDEGLVHGGFVFGLADYAAMVAINHPHVVLGSAEVRFVAPVRVGQVVTAVAVAQEGAGRKRVVDVIAEADGAKVFQGAFTTFVLDHHVLGRTG